MRDPRSSIEVRLGDQIRTFTLDELRDFASTIGLERVAASRYCWLFAAQTLWHMELHGISPFQIVAEVSELEAGTSSRGTKRASQFTRHPLKGLWHKHFFCGRFVGRNIRDQLAGGGLRALVEEVMNSSNSPIVTEGMISELSRRVVHETMEKRQNQGKLTGEWIVFAKHEDRNYYLSISTHHTGDNVIYDQVASFGFAQFPFLETAIHAR